MTERISALLAAAADALTGRVANPRTDAQILLAFVLGRDRSWLFAWPEHTPPSDRAGQFRALIERRRAGEPIAYLTGSRAFWSLDLAVTPATLIPRHETEHLVEAVLGLSLPADAAVLELGTGSGAIALALAAERPVWAIIATDASTAALDVARANAARCNTRNVEFRRGNWFAALPADRRFALIVSNPPYVADDDPYLSAGDLRFEPRAALAAGSDGLDALRHLIAAAPAHLEPGGWLWCEHGAAQGPPVRALLSRHGFERIATRRDLAGHERCSGGQLRSG